MPRLRRLPANLPLRRTSHRRRTGDRSGAESRQADPPGPRCDQAAQRVREAGGPLDSACYTCGCGLLFDAPVSTSVSCPHCGADQAW
ncbi:MAG TPA: hypothetical protein VLZ06_12135 [Solirubrobacteraceae bacterium]|nr:hypothetical protein [Solirubrobacteraceae bacterium]